VFAIGSEMKSKFLSTSRNSGLKVFNGRNRNMVWGQCHITSALIGGVAYSKIDLFSAGIVIPTYSDRERMMKMHNGKIIFIIACLLIGGFFIVAGCNNSSSSSNSSPDILPSPAQQPYIYTYTSSDADNHNHTARVYSTALSAPDANGWSDTSSTVLNHTHTMSLTQAQLTSMNAGQSVTVTSSTATNPTTGNSHYHTWTIVKAFNKASSAANNHTHDLAIPTNDPTAGVTYTTTQALNHTHTVTFTQQQLYSLEPINTSNAIDPVSGTSHYHTYQPSDLAKPW
jgi:hypothetical protein